MSKALEILEKLKEEKLNEYWSIMKEYRLPLASELNKIEEAIKEVKYLIENDDK